MSEEFARPILDALFDQLQAGHSDEDSLGLKHSRDPKRDQRLACGTGHDQSASGRLAALEMLQSVGNRLLLMWPGIPLLWSRGLTSFQRPENSAPSRATVVI